MHQIAFYFFWDTRLKKHVNYIFMHDDDSDDDDDDDDDFRWRQVLNVIGMIQKNADTCHVMAILAPVEKGKIYNNRHIRVRKPFNLLYIFLNIFKNLFSALQMTGGFHCKFVVVE